MGWGACQWEGRWREFPEGRGSLRVAKSEDQGLRPRRVEGWVAVERTPETRELPPGPVCTHRWAFFHRRSEQGCRALISREGS